MHWAPLASMFVGKRVGKWNVISKRQKDVADNGGYFSTCYSFEDDYKNKGFLKAYNYMYAFGVTIRSADMQSADILKIMAENCTYERDLLSFCKDHKMKIVVTAVDNGAKVLAMPLVGQSTQAGLCPIVE
ncbi:MAG: hypothetical protein NT178_15645 [Proteobacteria bacterium]|nr:hypothetical protein [Pseudomonadota bacterium]